MKKTYEKPELLVKEFASFENVFAFCNSTAGKECTYTGEHPGDASSNNKYMNVPGG